MNGRREFLAALPAAALALRSAPSLLSSRFALEAGVQLYTLREPMSADADATLAAVAEIGYTEVELWGMFARGGPELRSKLDALGLRAASSHFGLNDVRGDWDGALEAAQELGQSLIVVPSLPNDVRSADGLRRVADDFNRAGETARAAGMRFGYHNHEWEVQPLPDGTVPIELLLERTDAAYVDWQMDIFWTVHGGADAMAMLERHAGRITSVHVKDRTADGAMVPVGDGVIDFAALLPRAEQLGLLHAFVENDRPMEPPVEDVRRSYRALVSLGLVSDS